MEKNMEHEMDTYLWLARNAGMEKKMDTTITVHIGPTIRIHSFIPG